MEESGEKSQDATPHRRQQAREEGQIVQSQDLAAAIILLAGLLLLLALGGGLVEFFGNLARRQFGGDPWMSTNADTAAEQLRAILGELTKVALPILAALFAIGVASHLVQFGFLFLPDRLVPDFNRINPLSGFGRLFSISNLVRLGFGVVKILIVATVAFWSLYHRRTEILAVASMELPKIASFLTDIVLWTSLKIAGALFIVALLDYLFQWWKHEQDLKMTSQEVREEMRNLQGDPQVISRRRAVQRQLVLNRLAKAVPKADVVVTNPTELSIAILYDAETMAAPVVVAKGAGLVAQRIRKLALENGVPIVERKPLAQALYKQVELNRPIPDSMYAAVAEVLAYVYQLKGKPIPRPN
ncbi:MAG TPA: flagellar biosynthesis protein FlhB [Pirellulales bacterium]|jgi:flagellar biosynthetic protein FlhB|nr:flagellar biosynthesis protein FlhB [Pirellulales bacterium]